VVAAVGSAAGEPVVSGFPEQPIIANKANGRTIEDRFMSETPRQERNVDYQYCIRCSKPLTRGNVSPRRRRWVKAGKSRLFHPLRSLPGAKPGGEVLADRFRCIDFPDRR
jgi:hypothetical protein